MKIFQNKNLFKKLIIVLLFITIFSFCMPKVSRASVGGDLMDAVMDLFVGVGDGINTVLSKMILQTDGSFIVVDTETNGVAKILGIIVAAAVIIGGIVLIAAAPASLAVVSAIFTVVKAGVVAGVVTFAVTSYLSDATFGEKVVLPSIRLTPYEIFTNQIPLFDVDFFSPMTDLKTESSSKVSKNALKSGISSEDVDVFELAKLLNNLEHKIAPLSTISCLDPKHKNRFVEMYNQCEDINGVTEYKGLSQAKTTRKKGIQDIKSCMPKFTLNMRFYARPMYSPVRVSIRIISPCSMNNGTITLAPVSTIAGFVAPCAVSPLRPGSVSVI